MQGEAKSRFAFVHMENNTLINTKIGINCLHTHNYKPTLAPPCVEPGRSLQCGTLCRAGLLVEIGSGVCPPACSVRHDGRCSCKFDPWCTSVFRLHFFDDLTFLTGSLLWGWLKTIPLTTGLSKCAPSYRPENTYSHKNFRACSQYHYS